MREYFRSGKPLRISRRVEVIHFVPFLNSQFRSSDFAGWDLGSGNRSNLGICCHKYLFWCEPNWGLGKGETDKFMSIFLPKQWLHIEDSTRIDPLSWKSLWNNQLCLGVVVAEECQVEEFERDQRSLFCSCRLCIRWSPSYTPGRDLWSPKNYVFGGRLENTQTVSSPLLHFQLIWSQDVRSKTSLGSGVGQLPRGVRLITLT